MPTRRPSPYLIGGMACLVMPARSTAARRAWFITGGALLALAPLAHFASTPLVLAAVGGYLVVHIRRPLRASVVEAGILAGAALVVFGALSALSYLYFGHGDLISPTLRAARTLRTPKELKNWHSSNWRWVLYVPYVLVPPTVLGAWVVARGRQWRHVGQEELSIATAFGLQVLAYYVLQFGGGKEQTLEFHLFSSMLWSGAMLTLAFLLIQIGAPLLSRTRTFLVPALLVVAVPFVYRFWRPNITLHFRTGVFWPAATVVLAVPAFVGIWNSASAALATTGVVVLLLVLTVSLGLPHAPLPGTTLLPTGKYRAMLGESGTLDLNTYRVASELVKVVPPAIHAGEETLLWWPPGPVPDGLRAGRRVPLAHKLPSGGHAATEQRRHRRIEFPAPGHTGNAERDRSGVRTGAKIAWGSWLCAAAYSTKATPCRLGSSRSCRR